VDNELLLKHILDDLKTLNKKVDLISEKITIVRTQASILGVAGSAVFTLLLKIF